MKKEQEKKEKLSVYFDGLCPLCSREIEHYKRQVGAESIQFVDICGSKFNAEAEGLDPKQVHKVMHVKKADGTVVTRVGAFKEIWEMLPRYKKIAKLANLPGVTPALEVGYSIFAHIRPWLPRKKSADNCQSSPYCETKHHGQ